MRNKCMILLFGLLTIGCANSVASKQNKVIFNGNVEVVKNQKYGCVNIGGFIDNKVWIPQEDKEFAYKHPRRFYIDNKNKLHTDNHSISDFIKKI